MNNKPATIAKVELEQKINEAVRESGLPAFIIAYMFESMLGQLRQIEQRQYQDDMKRWEESQSKPDDDVEIIE